MSVAPGALFPVEANKKSYQSVNDFVARESSIEYRSGTTSIFLQYACGKFVIIIEDPKHDKVRLGTQWLF